MKKPVLWIALCFLLPSFQSPIWITESAPRDGGNHFHSFDSFGTPPAPPTLPWWERIKLAPFGWVDPADPEHGMIAGRPLPITVFGSPQVGRPLGPEIEDLTATPDIRSRRPGIVERDAPLNLPPDVLDVVGPNAIWHTVDDGAVGELPVSRGPDHCNAIPNAQGGLWFGPAPSPGLVLVVGSYYDVDVFWGGSPTSGTTMAIGDRVDLLVDPGLTTAVYARVWSLFPQSQWVCIQDNLWFGLAPPLLLAITSAISPVNDGDQVWEFPSFVGVPPGFRLFRQCVVDADGDGSFELAGHTLQLEVGP